MHVFELGKLNQFIFRIARRLIILQHIVKAIRSEVVDLPGISCSQESLAVVDFDMIKSLTPRFVDHEVSFRLCLPVKKAKIGGAEGVGKHDSTHLTWLELIVLLGAVRIGIAFQVSVVNDDSCRLIQGFLTCLLVNRVGTVTDGTCCVVPSRIRHFLYRMVVGETGHEDIPSELFDGRNHLRTQI